MLAAVVFCFFACIMPFKTLTLFIIACPFDVTDVVDTEVYFNLIYFCRVMVYINSAINPILYNVMSSKFRDGFKRVFLRCCGRAPSAAHGSLYLTNGALANTNTAAFDSTATTNKTFLDRVNSR